jgi:hypothetical protein
MINRLWATVSTSIVVCTKVSCLNRHYDVVVALLYGSTSGSTFESTFGSTSGSMPYLHIILYLRRYRILPEVLSGTFVPSKIEYFRKYFVQHTHVLRVTVVYCTCTCTDEIKYENVALFRYYNGCTRTRTCAVRCSAARQ